MTALTRLTDQAKEALATYREETQLGGEPVYPQWAADVLEVVGMITNLESRVRALEFFGRG